VNHKYRVARIGNDAQSFSTKNTVGTTTPYPSLASHIAEKGQAEGKPQAIWQHGALHTAKRRRRSTAKHQGEILPL